MARLTTENDPEEAPNTDKAPNFTRHRGEPSIYFAHIKRRLGRERYFIQAARNKNEQADHQKNKEHNTAQTIIHNDTPFLKG